MNGVRSHLDLTRSLVPTNLFIVLAGRARSQTDRNSARISNPFSFPAFVDTQAGAGV